MLRGEVLARWQEFVGTGEMTRGLEERIGRLRDRVTAFLLGREQPTAPVGQALESSVEALVRAAADGAAERTVDAWRVRAAGRALLGDRPRALAHVSDDFRPALEREIRAWQGRVLQLVAEEGRERRTAARLASFGTNGAGLALMLAVFAQTGGLSGVELLVAGGTTAASQKVLEAVFGDSAVRALAATARADLLDLGGGPAGDGARPLHRHRGRGRARSPTPRSRSGRPWTSSSARAGRPGGEPAGGADARRRRPAMTLTIRRGSRREAGLAERLTALGRGDRARARASGQRRRRGGRAGIGPGRRAAPVGGRAHRRRARRGDR